MPTLYANMTLYAIWVNQNAKIVKYNDNFGESADGVLQSALDELQSPDDFGWSVTGCKFMGWDTSSDGSGTRYNAGAKFSMDGQPLTLYAQWCPYDSENDIYTIECIYDWNALFNGQDIYDMDVKLSTGLGDFVPDISFTNEKTFSGTFDGNGQTLYNMSKSLFAVNSGWIKNFTAAYKYAIDNSYIYIDDDASVARTNNGIISGITISTNINGTTSSENVGGICAVNNGTVTDCKVSGKVSNIYAVNVGGIAGNNTDVVTKCTASGTVSGLQNVGGIAGRNVDGVTYCHSSATVSSAGSASNIGGIVGYNYYNGSTTFGELQYCLSWATVQATASIENTNVGGLIGKSYMSSAKTTVNKCAFAGSLYGGKYQGGIIGYSYYSSVYYSYTATVDSKYYTAVGQPTGLTALYGYKTNGTWSNTFSSSENGTSLTCDVTSITSKLSSLNGTTPLWTANTGANGVSTKLKYEIVRPE
ncbi:MAG: hypothetical protein IKP67_02470 [Spirochaetales bacterium]|nr:hypothetical protein [Spirochaetales bacterium]